MPPRQFRNIIFDLGNVLNHCDLEQGVATIARNSAVAADAIHAWLADSDVIDRFDGGSLSEGEFHQELVKQTGWNGTQQELSTIWQDMLSPNEEMIALMRRVQAEGFRVYILSNINPTHAKLIDGPLEFIELADGYVFSCECGMIKPNADIFHHLLRTFDLLPEETIFIDDRLQNVEAAQRLGIASILHSSFEETKQQLELILAIEAIEK